MHSLVSKVCRTRIQRDAVEKNSRANIALIRQRLIGGLFLNRLFFRCREPRPKLVCDGFGDFAFNRKHVVERTVIAFSPNACACPRIYQLRTYLDAVGRALNAALDSTSNSESIRNL